MLCINFMPVKARDTITTGACSLDYWKLVTLHGASIGCIYSAMTVTEVEKQNKHNTLQIKIFSSKGISWSKNIYTGKKLLNKKSDGKNSIYCAISEKIINVFPVLYTIFFLLRGWKMYFFPAGAIKCTLRPISMKVFFSTTGL